MDILSRVLFELWVSAARIFNPKRRNALFVILLGGPGAGKGTIASKLSEKYGVPHLSTGNLIRREIAEGTPIGVKWGPLIKSGKLVPDAVIFHLLTRELSKPAYYRGAILDGFPRTVNQARMLRRTLAWWGNKVDVSIYLNVPEQDLIERLSLRRTCSNPNCARTYHLKFSPPKQEGVCDRCGARILQRDDERAEAIVVRMKEFDATFKPLHDYYDELGLLVAIESRNDMGIDRVYEKVVFAVEEVD